MTVKTEMRKLQADITRRFDEILKPAPKWFPKRLWAWLTSIFLNI